MVVCYAISFLPLRLPRIFSGFLFLPQKPHTLAFWVTGPCICTALHSLLSSFLVNFISPSEKPFRDGTIHFRFAETRGPTYNVAR